MKSFGNKKIIRAAVWVYIVFVTGFFFIYLVTLFLSMFHLVDTSSEGFKNIDELGTQCFNLVLGIPFSVYGFLKKTEEDKENDDTENKN